MKLSPWFLGGVALLALAVILAVILAVNDRRLPDSQPANHPAPNRSRSPGQRPDVSTSSFVARHLAPDMHVVNGTVTGTRIEGPVVVTGTQDECDFEPVDAPQQPGDQMLVMRLGRMTDGNFRGAYVITAKSAHAAPDGVRFDGPLNVKMENEAGQWYEISSESAESRLFVSRDGTRKVFAAPDGGRFTGAEPPSDLEE